MTFFKGKLVLLQPYCVGLRIFDWWYRPNHVIAFSWSWRRLFTIGYRSNGAVKGRDHCLDVYFHLLGFTLNYTDYDFGRFRRQGN